MIITFLVLFKTDFMFRRFVICIRWLSYRPQ